MAFMKAIVAPTALYVFTGFLVAFGVQTLFFILEYSAARLYARFGRAHVICDPSTNTFPDFLKACLVILQYAVGSVAVAIPLMQHLEGEHNSNVCD